MAQKKKDYQYFLAYVLNTNYLLTVHATLSIHLTLAPTLVCKSVLHVCISIAALRTGSYTLTSVKTQPMGTCRLTQGTQAGLCDNLEGWEWTGGGRETQEGGTYVNLWLIHADVGQKSNQYCKAIINQLKINFSKGPEKCKIRDSKCYINLLAAFRKYYLPVTLKYGVVCFMHSGFYLRE